MQIPKSFASGVIFRRYSKGSFHSSSVGRYVGASWRPCGRLSFVFSLTAVGCPRRSTDVRSKAVLESELRGVCGLFGWYPLELTFGFGFDDVPAGVTLGELRVLPAVLCVPVGAAPAFGTETMVDDVDEIDG